MSTDPGYRVRLKARIGKGLSTDDSTRTANFHGRPLTVRAADEDQPLNEARWLVFSARGFATGDEAHDYGERLRRAVRLAGISTVVGVDARTAGDDRTTSHLSPAGEDWMRSLGLLRPEHRTAPDVHGLSVLPDDDNLRVFSSTADGRVTHDPAEFIRSLEEAAEGTESHETARALHALNLAQINHEPLAQVVLAVSSIEAMAADNEGWTDAQLGMIEWAAARVRNEFGTAANPVMDAIQKTHHRSLRQQTRRLLERHGLLDRWSEWENVYARRSGLFHGGAGGESPDVHRLAADAMRVCGGIVLSIARREGAVLPNAAHTHFRIG